MPIQLRPTAPDDAATIVRLNAEAVAWTAPMDAEHWRALERMAALSLVAARDETLLGFVLVLDEDAPYGSDNHRWFRERVRRFTYVDRVVVDAAARGLGVGRTLYDAVLRWAQAHGKAWIAAEVVEDPPNADSLRFHSRAGFVRVGSKASGEKRLAMLLRPVGATGSDAEGD